MGSKTKPARNRAAEIDAALKALFDALAATPPSPELRAQIEYLERKGAQPAAPRPTPPTSTIPNDQRPT